MRTFQPTAERVAVIDAEGGAVVETLDKVHDAGFFAGRLDRRASRFPYRLCLELASVRRDIDDPYRFPSALNDAELRRLAAGDYLQAHELLGARRAERAGVEGVVFAVWAPNASRVSVVGPFNDWDGRRHAMRLHPSCGVKEIFIPGLQDGEFYKYEIRSAAGELLLRCLRHYGSVLDWTATSSISVRGFEGGEGGRAFEATFDAQTWRVFDVVDTMRNAHRLLADAHSPGLRAVVSGDALAELRARRSEAARSAGGGGSAGAAPGAGAGAGAAAAESMPDVPAAAEWKRKGDAAIKAARSDPRVIEGLRARGISTPDDERTRESNPRTLRQQAVMAAVE